MTNTSSSRQFRRLGAPGICIIVLGFVLFVLIFFLEYAYNNKRGDLLGSIIYVIPFSSSLTASSLAFVTGNAERRRTHIPWHRQKSILVGLLLLSLSLLTLVQLVNSLMNNGLPDAVGLLIAGGSCLLALFVFVRLAMTHGSKPGTD